MLGRRDISLRLAGLLAGLSAAQRRDILVIDDSSARADLIELQELLARVDGPDRNRIILDEISSIDGTHLQKAIHEIKLHTYEDPGPMLHVHIERDPGEKAWQQLNRGFPKKQHAMRRKARR